MKQDNSTAGAPSDPTAENVGDSDKKQKNKNAGGIADYLSAPRKKRKSYVIQAMGSGMRGDIITGISAFIKNNFKTLAQAQPRTAEELRKHFSRQIVLLIMDDEFAGLEPSLNLIAELKQKKSNIGIPVLFMTRQPEALVETYNRLLLPFHESDEYINYTKTPMSHILSKVRQGLTNQNRRRSRRYKIEAPISFFSLTHGCQLPGVILDLSLHGALIRTTDSRLFRMADQIKIHLPIANYLLPTEGDYLKISARIRRVFISGDLAGVSFEHVTDKQVLMLTKYLTEVVNAQTSRRLGQKARPPVIRA